MAAVVGPPQFLDLDDEPTQPNHTVGPSAKQIIQDALQRTEKRDGVRARLKKAISEWYDAGPNTSSERWSDIERLVEEWPK